MLSIHKAELTSSTAAPIILIYGIGGIGKTSLAGEFEDVIYLPTGGERPPGKMALASPGTLRSYDDVYDVMSQLRREAHPYKWLILDSVDGLEPLIWEETCRLNNWNSIEQPGFGKGYLAADAVWNEFFDWLADLQRDGMGVILIGHSKIVRFDSPTTEPYNRYTIKLQERANNLLREKVDIVAFMQYRVSIREKEVKRNVTVSHAEGGKTREIGLNTSASYDAKNRYDMPDTIVYKKGHGFNELSKYFPRAIGVPK